VTTSKHQSDNTLGLDILFELRFEAMLSILDEVTAISMRHCSATTSSQRTSHALKSGRSSGVS
jgi:hypothetical protein